MTKVRNIFHEFLKHYFHSGVWNRDTKWLGVPILNFPLDLFLFQEMIVEIKPDLIVECGTYNGGSALFFASILDLINKGKVITIDTAPQPNLPSHPRITYFKASSTSPEAIAKVKAMINPGDAVMVFLDSDHRKNHVLSEMRLYNQFVSKGSYMVVEDTCINGHPILPNYGPGPMEAVEEFLIGNNEFFVDESKHKFFVTFHPRGFLRKK
ncbi:CmcI family methyltransferase [Ammoniphilus sp. 3BR4]|uniref:CmcI family methyltransferase n=1 Tax=Ammoniphilus sp. 3BR4 TaxID=3158265 RepID=UPI0034659795